ncbi:polysaccharide lyase family 8 super-sandwich domain-containing protein [Streptomyces smyrnaeus]|uniref:polysaccharide lyase family 8 super-sandwich domain-containing protein n=1 Tax=Streptomyces smyrnaeus TaxID=1387713 RepID=UPI00367D03DE
MEITRRHVLSLLSAAGLAAVIPASEASAASGAPPGRLRDTGAGTGTGVERLLGNARAVLAGTAESNSRPETAAKLAAVARTARGHLADMAAAGENELFRGLPLGTSDANLNTTFRRLYEIALASRTPGLPPGGPPNDPATRRRVVDGLVRLHERYYGDQSQGYYGNWHHWEIGISTSVTATLLLLAPEVADEQPELTRRYVASMDAYLRNGKDGDVDLDSRFHTGANLADITTNRILQGALLDDGARIRKALEDQLTVYATIDPYQLRHGVTDGHYADGSFIQHASVAYTGSYGKGLLARAVQVLKFLDGTGYADTGALVPVVHRWVTDGFAPVIFEGWMMEIVKGRAVSRTGSGYADSAAVAEAVTDLSAYADDERAAALKSYVKHLDAASAAPPDPARFASPLTVVRHAEIMADGSVPAADLNPAARCTAFNAMDRTVHRRPGHAFALARSSERISKYEYMNGENLLPWFQGDGAYYLYLAGEDQRQAFGVDYFTTVPPYGLAGVTAPEERRKTIPELYGKPYYDNPDHPLHFTASSESQNTYVYFPRGTDRHPVTVGLETVTRSRRVVRTANPDTAVTRQVFHTAFRQDAGTEPRSLAYALVPHATERALRGYGADGGPLSVLANTTRLQAVRHTGLDLLAVNSFARGRQTVAGLRVDGPASVLVHRERGGRRVTVAVSDPTMRRDRLTLLVRGRRLRPVSSDPGIRVGHTAGGTLLRVHTHHAYGRTFTVTLR